MEKITVESLSTANVVLAEMEKLGLPKISKEALVVIGKAENADFKNALVKISNGEDESNHSRNYVLRVTGLLTGPVLSMLASLGYNIPFEVLIKIGKDCARDFRANISGAAKNDKQAIEWVKTTVAKYMPLNASAKPSVAQPQQKQSNVTQMEDRRSSNYPSGEDDQPYYPDSENDVGGHAENKSDREFFSMTFYGNKSALCFNASCKDNEHTLVLDGGNKKEGQGDKGRAINWADKVIFGFSFEEMIELAWVLLGLSESCKFLGHGAGHDKSFEFKRQEKGYYGAVSAKDKGIRGVPMSQASGLRLLLLVTRQINKNYPNMTVNEILSMIRTMKSPSTNPKVVNG